MLPGRPQIQKNQRVQPGEERSQALGATGQPMGSLSVSDCDGRMGEGNESRQAQGVATYVQHDVTGTACVGSGLGAWGCGEAIRQLKRTNPTCTTHT